LKRKIFQQIASVALSATLVITGMPAVLAADAAFDTVAVSYDASADKLSLDVDLAVKGKKMVSVMVVPADIADISPQTLAAKNDVVIKAIQTGADGSANCDIVLPAGITGRYNVMVSANNSDYVYGIYDVATSDVDNMYSAIAGGNYGACANGLANTNTTTAEAANIAKFIESNKATVTDGTSAVNAYLSGEAIAYVMSGKMEIGAALDTYKNYIGDTYIADYLSNLTAEEKVVMNQWFVKNGNTAPFATVYNNNKFLAQYQSADTAVHLGEILINELVERNMTALLNKYNSISNPVNKEAVLDALFNKKNTVAGFDGVLIDFEEECEKQGANADDVNNNHISQGAGPGGGGGGGGATTGTIGNLPMPGVGYSNFADVDGHWAKASIDVMYGKGIINGFEDGTFRPELNVTRAEFAKMIVCLLGLDANGSADFKDVADNSWYNGYVAAAAKAGIVKGAEDGKFNPNAYITRQDAAVMLARVLEYKSIAMDNKAIEFNDSDKIAKYAQNSVNGMANLGIISGYNGGFAPLDNTTRAQAAALLQRVADHIG
jgi:hypothetical protein